MYLESVDFVIRDRKDDDQEIILQIEKSMPWVKAFPEKREEEIYLKNLLDYISKDEQYWIIERKNGEVLVSLSIDIDDESEAHIYIHLIENIDMTGFGEQMLDKVSQYLHQKYGITTLLSGKLDDASSSSLFQAELHRGGACAAHCLM